VLQAEQVLETLQHGPGGAGAVAVVAHEPAHEQAVALLDPGLVVLAIGPAAGETDAAALAPAEQAGVDGSRVAALAMVSAARAAGGSPNP